MAILGRATTQCGCCGHTILAAAPTPARALATSWARPLRRRSGKIITRVSCSRSNEAVPFAIFTKTSEPLTQPLISEDLLDVTEQERRLSDAGKAISPSTLLRVGVDVDEGKHPTSNCSYLFFRTSESDRFLFCSVGYFPCELEHVHRRRVSATASRLGVLRL